MAPYSRIRHHREVSAIATSLVDGDERPSETNHMRDRPRVAETQVVVRLEPDHDVLVLAGDR